MKSHSERLQELFFFGRDVLGYKQFTELHLSWFDILLREKYILMCAPVGHFKTSACTITYPLFRLMEDPNMRILLVNEILDQSKGFLREIKAHLTENQRFREKYGNWDLQANTWTEERIQIPRTEIRKEPSIAVGSVLGTVVSMHPNLIIVDDPCSNRNTQTYHQRAKVMGWFQRDLLPRLDDGGQIIVIMTRWHSEDLAGFIKSDPGFSHWKVINLAADWIDEKGNPHILFPEKFNEQKLNLIRAQMGTLAYNCLYRNDPAGGEKADFKLAWIESARYKQLPDDLTVYAGVDPAITKREEGSRFAICVVGVSKARDVYVLDAYHDQLSFLEQKKAIERIYHVHKPTRVIIETNGYQNSLVQSLRSDPETKNIPIEPHHTKGDKHERIRGLTPYFENGTLRMPERLENLEEQLIHFPTGKDDLLDALYLALRPFQEKKIEPCINFVEDLA